MHPWKNFSHFPFSYILERLFWFDGGICLLKVKQCILFIVFGFDILWLFFSRLVLSDPRSELVYKNKIGSRVLHRIRVGQSKHQISSSYRNAFICFLFLPFHVKIMTSIPHFHALSVHHLRFHVIIMTYFLQSLIFRLIPLSWLWSLSFMNSRWRKVTRHSLMYVVSKKSLINIGHSFNVF